MTIEIPPHITELNDKLDWLNSQKKYVAIPRRKIGKLPNTASAKDYRDAAEELERFEATYNEAKKLEEEYRPHNNAVQQAINDLIEDESGLKDLDIPDWQKSKIRNLAYDQNNGSGYMNYYQILLDYVDLFINN
ncbi:hypothetical protein Pam2_142 [Pseudanabaena phage Pam2]|nr:hypothetical protein Pam2_142 [Pseudanabaena phage Pam2]